MLSAIVAELEQSLGRIPGMRILGNSAEGERCGCLSFTVEGIHAYDMSRFLDQYGIAARSGHHCAMPYLTALGCEFAVRFSVAPYNTSDEIMYTADTCEKICELIRNAVESGRRRRSIIRNDDLCPPGHSLVVRDKRRFIRTAGKDPGAHSCILHPFTFYS